MSYKETFEPEDDLFNTDDRERDLVDLVSDLERGRYVEVIDSDDDTTEPTDSLRSEDEEQAALTRLDLKRVGQAPLSAQADAADKARSFVHGLLMGIAFANRTESQDMSN